MIIDILSGFALLYHLPTHVDCTVFLRIVYVRFHELVSYEIGEGHQHNADENN